MNQIGHKPKRARIKNSTNQIGHEPKRAWIKKSTKQKGRESKTAQTKKGTNQKWHKPKRARIKNSTNQKGHIYIIMWDVGLSFFLSVRLLVAYGNQNSSIHLKTKLRLFSLDFLISLLQFLFCFAIFATIKVKDFRRWYSLISPWRKE